VQREVRKSSIPPGRRGKIGGRSSGTSTGSSSSTGAGGGGRKPDRSLGGDQVEGRQAVRELLLAGRRGIREIWISGDAEDAPILGDIVELATSARVLVREVGKGKFAAQARCEAPQGVLALASPLQEVPLDDLITGTGTAARGRKGPPFLVALDGVTDPGNLGAVLRSAECAGATGVILPRHRAVHVTPAATKAAAGAIEHLPMAVVGGLPAALAQLRKEGVLVLGLDGAADRQLAQLSPADGPVCLVLGAEGRGLSRLVRERCDEVVAIPLRGRLGSLNVAAAAALACFEIARHRS
jgi:23S rRNA (guanosine2251-2'-O)-methyltransferase